MSKINCQNLSELYKKLFSQKEDFDIQKINRDNINKLKLKLKNLSELKKEIDEITSPFHKLPEDIQKTLVNQLAIYKEYFGKNISIRKASKEVLEKLKDKPNQYPARLRYIDNTITPMDIVNVYRNRLGVNVNLNGSGEGIIDLSKIRNDTKNRPEILKNSYALWFVDSDKVGRYLHNKNGEMVDMSLYDDEINLIKNIKENDMKAETLLETLLDRLIYYIENNGEQIDNIDDAILSKNHRIILNSKIIGLVGKLSTLRIFYRSGEIVIRNVIIHKEEKFCASIVV